MAGIGRSGGTLSPGGPILKHMTAGDGERAGPLAKGTAPSGAHRKMRGTERVLSPAPFHPGRCGVSPLEGVAGDDWSAPAQGKTFPLQDPLARLPGASAGPPLLETGDNGPYAGIT